MPAINFQEVLRCSSEDEIFQAKNIISGNQKWTCSKENNKETIEAEFLFKKEAVISYIDIGNEGSQFVDLLVSHSTRNNNNEYFTLLPTFTLMSVTECRQRTNRRKVLMFKKDDIMADAREKRWDKLKIVCRQSYPRDTQFGLNFLSLRSIQSSPKTLKEKKTASHNSNQRALKTLFGMNGHVTETCKTSPILSTANQVNCESPVQRRIDQSKGSTPVTTKTISSPQVSKSMTMDQQNKFLEEASKFLGSVKKEILLHPQLKVSDIRLQFEENRQKILSKTEKILLMVLLSEKKLDMSVEKKLDMNENIRPSPATTSVALPTPVAPLDLQCEKCGVCLPPGVGEIHAKICTTPKRKRDAVSRNSLCLDMTLDDDGDDEKQAPRSKIRCKRSGSFSLHSKANGRTDAAGMRKTSGSYVSSSTLTKASKDEVDLQVETLHDVFELEPKPKHVISGGTVHADKCNGPVRQIKRLFQRDVEDVMDMERSEALEEDSSRETFKIQSPENKFSDVIEVSPEPSSNTKVDCPLCFEAIDIARIETHAAYCNGEKTTTVIEVAEDDVIHDDVINRPDTEECPVCKEQISVYKIGIHASLCANTKYKNNNIVATMPAKKDTAPFKPIKSASVPVAKDLSQCPICLAQFNKSYIDFHVNICLDSSM